MSDVKFADLTAPIMFDDLEPIKVPVRHKGIAYWLVEAMADGALKYRNALSAGMSMDPATMRMSTGGLAEAEPLVVAHCLYAAANVTADNPDGELPLANGKLDPRHRVRLETLITWKIAVQQALFERLCAISPGLTKDAKKKDATPSGNGDGGHEDAAPKGGPRPTENIST